MKLRKGKTELVVKLDGFMKNLDNIIKIDPNDIATTDITHELIEIISLYTSMLECKEKNSIQVKKIISELYNNITELSKNIECLNKLENKEDSNYQKVVSDIASKLEAVKKIYQEYVGKDKDKETLQELFTKLEHIAKTLDNTYSDDAHEIGKLVNEMEPMVEVAESYTNTKLGITFKDLYDNLSSVYRYLNYKQIVQYTSTSNEKYLPTILEQIEEQNGISYEELLINNPKKLERIEKICHDIKKQKGNSKKYLREVKNNKVDILEKEETTVPEEQEIIAIEEDQTTIPEEQEIMAVVEEPSVIPEEDSEKEELLAILREPIKLDRKMKKEIFTRLDKWVKDFDTSNKDLQEMKTLYEEMYLLANMIGYDEKTSLGKVIMKLYTNLKAICNKPEYYEYKKIVTYVKDSNEDNLPSILKQIEEKNGISYDEMMKETENKVKEIEETCIDYAKMRKMKLDSMAETVEPKTIKPTLSIAKIFENIQKGKEDNASAKNICINEDILKPPFRIGQMVLINNQKIDNTQISFGKEGKVEKIILYLKKQDNQVEAKTNEDLEFFLNAGYEIIDVITKQEVLVHYEPKDIEPKKKRLFK